MSVESAELIISMEKSIRELNAHKNELMYMLEGQRRIIKEIDSKSASLNSQKNAFLLEDNKLRLFLEFLQLENKKLKDDLRSEDKQLFSERNSKVILEAQENEIDRLKKIVEDKQLTIDNLRQKEIGKMVAGEVCNITKVEPVYTSNGSSLKVTLVSKVNNKEMPMTRVKPGQQLIIKITNQNQ
jgi:hypothetical protein